MAIVIANADLGIYIGNFLGMGFWTKLDSGKQDHAITFESEGEARRHIATWDEGAGGVYEFVDVPDDDPYISFSDLIRMGHKQHFTAEDVLRHAPVETMARA